MKLKRGIMVALCLTLGALAQGKDTYSTVGTNSVMPSIGGHSTHSMFVAPDRYYYASATTNLFGTGKWTVDTTVTFGDGIVMDTETGEVEFPASVTNMTEAARQFWRAVCEVSGAEQSEWLGEPRMEVVTTATTNTVHPKQYKYITCYPTNPPQYVESWSDTQQWSLAMPEERDNPDVRITVVTEKRELLVRFEGQEHRILLGEREVSRVREERKVEETWEVAK